MIRRTCRTAVLLLSLMLVASCGQLSERETRPESSHTTGELCRYPLDFFTNLGRPGLEVIDPTSKPDQKINELGFCVIDGQVGEYSSLFVNMKLARNPDPFVERLAKYDQREAIQVGADTVWAWSRSDGKARELRVDIDEWTGHMMVGLLKIGEPTADQALADEHLPAAAEMLVRMTRDLKGPT